MRFPAALSPSLTRLLRIGLVVAAGDLLSKALAARLWSAESFHVTNWLALSVIQNHGGAFGWSAGAYTWQLNLALTLAAVVFVIPVTRDLSRVDANAPVALGLIVGGALGNLVSLLAPPAGVGDFISLEVNPGHSVVLNLADLAAYAGLALILRTGFRIAGALLAQTRRSAAVSARVGSAYASKADAKRQLRRVRIAPIAEVVVADWDRVPASGIVLADAPEREVRASVVPPAPVTRPMGVVLDHRTHSGELRPRLDD
jgi:signal peptidase II